MSIPTATVGGPLTGQEAIRSPDSPERESILLSLSNCDVSEQSLTTARALATGMNTDLIVQNAICVPEQTPLSLPSAERTKHRAQMHRVLDTIEDTDADIPVHGTIRIGHHLVHVLATAVEKYDITTVIADKSWWTASFSPIVPTVLERLTRNVECTVVLPTGAPLPETISSILVPVAGGPHSGTATDIAHAIARAHDAHIELFHVVTPTQTNPEQVADQYVSPNRTRLDSFDNVDTWILEAEDAAEAIIDQSQYYDATVIGAPRTSRLRRFIFGSTAQSVQDHASNTVITTWR
ncbi:universal stress protein [Haladaptatus sp. NG-SE-30]